MEPTPPVSLQERAQSPEQAVVDRLMPLVYDELRALAERYLRGRGIGQTLQPTGLVHEAYVRFLREGERGQRLRPSITGHEKR